MTAVVSERATFGGLLRSYGDLVDRIAKRQKNREPVWYPEIEFLIMFTRLVVLSVRAKTSEQKQRLSDLTALLDVLATRARECREPQ